MNSGGAVLCRKAPTRGQNAGHVGLTEASTYVQAAGRWQGHDDYKQGHKSGSLPALVPVNLKAKYDSDDRWVGMAEVLGADRTLHQDAHYGANRRVHRKPYLEARPLVRQLKLGIRNYPGLMDNSGQEVPGLTNWTRGGYCDLIWNRAASEGHLPEGVQGATAYQKHDAGYVSPEDFIGLAGLVERLFPGFITTNSRDMDRHHKHLVDDVALVGRKTYLRLKKTKRGLFHGITQEDEERKIVQRGQRQASLGQMPEHKLIELFRRLQQHARQIPMAR